MDDDSRVTIEYLRGLPPGAVVHWSTHHFSRREPWTTHWVDVRIEEEGSPPMNWVWTILAPDDPDGAYPGQLWQFVWPYDLDVHCMWEAGERINVFVAARGEPLPECIAAGYEHLPENFDCSYEVRGGWSVATAGDALSHWAATHGGRPDLRFEWEPDAEPSPVIREVMERARELDEGGPSWDLGDGIRVADGFLDELLAMDPDERAEVMEAIREAHRRHFGDVEESDSN
ncbi:MAG: hypothetical protein HY658_12645 [Actinobacteria bacterium]|nr:hypothetical protein [Actinomycetota bacterium]